MKVSGVIFDMDGLMFDTERLVNAAWRQMGRELGLELLDGMPDIMGVNANQAREIFKARFGPDFDYDAARRRRTVLVREMIQRDGLPVKPGLYDLLKALDRHRLPAAVATSSDREMAEWYLELAGVRDAFAAVVCGDMVERSKPDPQIFQLTAGLLGSRPEETVVLEDSFHGIRAAAAGGFLPYMVPDLRQPTPEISALLRGKLDTLADLIPLLEEDRL